MTLKRENEDDYKLAKDIPDGFTFYGRGDESLMPKSGADIRYYDVTGWREIDTSEKRKFKNTDLYCYQIKNKKS